MLKNSCALLSATAIAAAFLCPGFASAGDPSDLAKTPAVDVGNQVWTQPLIGGGVKTNDVYTDGNLFLTVPVWSTIGKDGTLGGDYVFLEPYSSLGEQGEIATSLGLSWRHLFSNEHVDALQKQGMAGFMEEGWFIGGNVFVDMLDTQHNNNFWQMGVGAEAGTRYFEVRGNYYIPMTGEKLYERDVNTQSFSSSSSSLATQDTFGNPLATGNSIVQPVSSQTLATTTTSTTTVRTVTELFEKGMKGWDAEASVLVPWVDQWMDLRFSGGYLSFDNQPFGPQNGPTGPVHGWKSGVELRPVPAVVLGADWYADKRFAGSSWIVSAELGIPLDHTWKDAFKMRRRHLVEHIAEPVHRQNDAIKIGNDENQQSTSSTSVARVTRVVSQSATNIVLKDDVVFVNNGGPVGNGIQAGSAMGNGTAEKPVNTVQAGATLAGTNSNNQPGQVWTAYIQGGGNPAYTENVNVVGSTSFVGSGTGGGIVGMGGKMFGGTGAQPHIAGGFANANILPVSFLEYRGLQITGGNSANSDHAIDAQNVTTLLVTNNTISNIAGTGAGVHVLTDDEQLVPGTAVISGNTFNAIGGNAVDISTLSSSVLTATVSNNAFNGSTGDALRAQSHNASTLTLAVTGNTIANQGGLGVNLRSLDTSSFNATVSGNRINSGPFDGMDIVASNGSKMQATVSGNNIAVGTNDAGIFFERDNTATFTGVINGNVIQPGAGLLMNDAVEISDGTAGPGFNVSIIGNTISGVPAPRYGIDAGDVATLLIQNNTITNSQGYGIFLLTSATGTMNATVTGNTISVLQDALDMQVSDTSTLTATIAGNSLTNATPNATVNLSTSATSHATVNFIGNTFSGATAFSGVDAESSDSSTLSVGLTSNTFNTMAGVAVRGVSNNTSTLGIIASANHISGPGGGGFSLTSKDGSTLNGSFMNNTIIGQDIGIDAEAANTTVATGMALSINGNTITGSGTFGIKLVPVTGAVINVNKLVTPINNVITGSGTKSMSGATTGNTGGIEINGVLYTLPIDAP